MRRFLISLFSFLSWLGAGINALTLSQIKSKFEELREDSFLKQAKKPNNNSIPSYSPWNLIYASGSFSFLKKFMDQILLSPNAPNLLKADAVNNPVKLYPKIMQALVAKFLRNLDYSTLISPIETSDSKENAEAVNGGAEKTLPPFKSKFSNFNAWLELGIFSLVLESLFLLALASSSIWFWKSSNLSVKKRLKQLAYFLSTNLISYLFNYLKKAKVNLSLSDRILEINPAFYGMKLSKLNYFVGGERILREINLTIQKGEFYAIIGPNGAGKTTLLKNIAGLLSPEGGSIECSLMERQKYHSFLSYNSFWKNAVYIPQELNIQEDTSVYDFLMYSRFIFLKRLKKASTKDHIGVLNALKLCGLHDMRYSRMGELSGGQKQKVILASIIVRSDAELILLDEPTTHLDIENRNFLLSFFKELSKSGKTIIANLHNFVEISELATKIIALKEGKIEKVGDKQDVLNPAFLNSLYELTLSERTWRRFCSPSSFSY